MPSAIMLGGARPVAFGPRTADGRRAGRVYLRRFHLAGSHPHALGRVLPLAASHGRQIASAAAVNPTSVHELTQ
jgi:hypothetical protein